MLLHNHYNTFCIPIKTFVNEPSSISLQNEVFVLSLSQSAIRLFCFFFLIFLYKTEILL